MKKRLLMLLLLIFVMSACGTKQPAPLVGTWKLTAYGPKDTPTPAIIDANAELTFNQDGTVGGSGGCNSFGGTYEVDGNQITFNEMTSTLMACDDARMAQEGAVLQVLSGTVEYQIQGNVLTLTNNDKVLVFASKSVSYSYP